MTPKKGRIEFFYKLLLPTRVPASSYQLMHSRSWSFVAPGTPAITAWETPRYPEIVLPRKGAYVRHDAAGSIHMDRTVLAFFEGGRPYRIEP